MEEVQIKVQSTKVGKAIAKCVWDSNFLGGWCIPPLRMKANEDLRSNFFTPWACARASDMSGGRINGSTFTLLREIYTGGKQTSNCPLPSASTVNSAKYALNRYAFHHDIAMWETFNSSTGEGIRFTNIPKFIDGIFKAYEIDEVAKRETVDIVVAHDGFLLTNVLSANMLGIKINDYNAVCPRTKIPLFLMNDEKNPVNSSMHCYPLVIVMGKESESLI